MRELVVEVADVVRATKRIVQYYCTVAPTNASNSRSRRARDELRFAK
jgi:hypothetical protein